jgi:hypothetical protein
LLAGAEGVGQVLDASGKVQAGLDHPHSGELVLIARDGFWFAYPWWSEPATAPDYARHIDIHNKPGYDPCELFFGWPPMSVSRKTERICGSHGRTGAGREAVWASTFIKTQPATLVELSQEVRNWLNEA